MVNCETCQRNDAVWAWQPEFDSIVTLGSHYRGSAVIKICGDCRKKIRNQKAIVSEWIVLAMMQNGWKIRYDFHEYGYSRAVAGLGTPVEFMESADLVFDDYTRSKTVNIRTFRIMLRKGLLDVDRCQIAHPDHASHASVKVFYALKRDEPRPASSPAAIKQVSVAVEVSDLKSSAVSVQDAPNSSATGKQVNHITDWILRARILDSLDALNWRRELSGGTWLEMWFDEGVWYG